MKAKLFGSAIVCTAQEAVDFIGNILELMTTSPSLSESEREGEGGAQHRAGAGGVSHRWSHVET